MIPQRAPLPANRTLSKLQLPELEWDYQNGNGTTKMGMGLPEWEWNYYNGNGTAKAGMGLVRMGAGIPLNIPTIAIATSELG